jgi:hypothetical protein
MNKEKEKKMNAVDESCTEVAGLATKPRQIHPSHSGDVDTGIQATNSLRNVSSFEYDVQRTIWHTCNFGDFAK